MRGTQKADLYILCGSSTSNESVEPALPVVSRPALQSTPASATLQPKSKYKNDHTTGWVETTGQVQSTSDIGLLGELSELNLMLLEEIKSAVSGYQDVTPVQEILEVRKRFKLWKDQRGKLDQDLGEATDVRNSLVEILTLLALDLEQGIKYYNPQQQSDLRQKISRVVEQAKILVEFDSPNLSEIHPVHNIVDFLNAKSGSFTSRVDRLFDMLPIIDQSFVSTDRIETGQKQRVGQHEVRSGISRQSLSEIRQSPDATLHTSQSSTIFRKADYHEPLSISARCSIKQSSSDTESSQSHSLYSGDDGLDSGHLPADTITSPSTPHRARSSTWPSSSNASMSIQDRRNFGADKSVLIGPREAIPNAHAHNQAHSHHPAEDDWIEDCQTYTTFQSIRIRNSHGQKLTPYYNAKFDTAAEGNFITRSLVEECEYKLHPRSDSDPSFCALNKYPVPVSGWVLPDWQFLISRQKRRRKEVRFWVIENLPSELDMLIGDEFLQDMGIRLRGPRDVLVVHRDWGKDVSGQSKSQRDKQAQEGAANQDRSQKTLSEKHEAVGKTTQHSKSQNPQPQKESANKNHSQHRKS